MLEAYSRAWCEIDYDTIEHNLKEIQKLMNKTKVMGIVKANAYGLGALPIAKTLRDLGIDYFGVSSVDEAIELREGGIQENILVRVSIPAQTSGPRSKLGRKEFIWLTLPYCCRPLRQGSAISGLYYRCYNILWGYNFLVVLRRHGVGQQIHRGGFHPLQLVHRLLHVGGTGGACHPRDVKFLLCHRFHQIGRAHV